MAFAMLNARLVLALAIGLTPVTPSIAATYKWTDDDGNVVYSQTKPPGGRAVEVVKQHSTGVTDEEAKRQLEGLRDKANAQSEDRQLKAEVAQDELDRNQRIKKNCENARKNLSLLETPARVTLMDADGNPYFLGEEQRQERVLEAKSQVERYCD